MRPDALCGLLAEDSRLRAFASVVLGAGTPAEVASVTGLTARDVVRALRRLEEGGLVQDVDGRLLARSGEFKDAVREHGPGPVPDEPLDPDQERAAVLRVFVRAGRLAQVPAARGKRRIVLERIAAEFEPGVRYPERTVNEILLAWHDDYAAIRRYLVDEGLLAREQNVYWRSGGYVEVSSKIC